MEKALENVGFIDGLVSVVTPLYNCEKFIESTVLSIVNQTYKNLEVIIVDDCSTDNSNQKVLELQKKYPQIIYNRQNQNVGAGVARNVAIKLAKGRFIAFCDSDDVWKPDKLQKQIDLMMEKNCPFSYTAIDMIDEEGNLKKKKRKIKTVCTYNKLLRNTMIATSSVVLDRAFYGEIVASDVRGGQDYATWITLLRNGVTACGVDEALVSYRVRAKSLSSNKFKSFGELWDIQTRQEKINGFKVFFNLIAFGFNALKKYLF